MPDVQGVEICSLSDKGQSRPENQDSILVDSSNGLFILADGAGGGRGGATASRLTVDTMAGALKSVYRKIRRYPLWNRDKRVPQLTGFLSIAAQAANKVVVDQASATPNLAGMASTLVAGVVDRHRCITITAGDSRIYHFHEGRLEQISRDHSLSRSLIDQGFLSEQDSNVSKYRNVLTQAVGMQDKIEVSSYDFPLVEGDLVLACSDGLTNMVSDQTITAVLSATNSLEEKARLLIDKANDAGGLDNISVILARYNNPPTFFSRFLGLKYTTL
ncbi:MAG: serine/threonine-protein phosphatase [Gammaproteobacteria bacterium]|nr:serine/threonine-protein phosphatase [Gammaproteobacteria bacterium]